MNAPTRTAAVLIVLVLAACRPGPTETERPPNLLLVTVDTLRADHLGAYGYERATSPELDRLAEESVVFENAHAQTSWTLASLASLATSQWVGRLGIRDFRSRLSQDATTLPEVLRSAGYETAAVGTHLVFLEKYGLRQGIDDFDDELVIADYTESHRAVTSAKVSDKALAWLERRRGSEQPWFLWLHYFDPHIPYVRHRLPGMDFGDGPRDRYDSEIAFTDFHIGRVLEQLRSSASPTVVVVTSDHGEEFRDHGGKEHGHTLYQELIRVPLLVRAPGLEPARVAERVRLVDVMPTVLELLEVPAALHPNGLEGESLLRLLEGPLDAPLPCFSELRLRAHTEADSLISGRWKLVVPLGTEVAELYDLDRDPREARDLAARRPELAATLRAQLEDLARGSWATTGSADELELHPEEVEALRNLGYLGGD